MLSKREVCTAFATKNKIKTEGMELKTYNKRTWLNKEDSPSLGSVVAFDGVVDYSEGSERTTFFAISDCRFTIKLTKNTESIEDFTEKMELLKTEIELFINHLKIEK